MYDPIDRVQRSDLQSGVVNGNTYIGISFHKLPLSTGLAPTIPFQEYVCWNSFCNGWLAKRGRFQMIWSMLIFDQQQMTPFNVTWPQCQLLNWTCVMYLLKALGMNAWATSTVIDDSPELIFKLSKNLYELWRSCYFPTLPIYIRQWWPAAVDLQHRKSFLSRNNSCLYCFIKQMSHFGVFIQSIDLYFQTHTMSLEIRMIRSSPILWPTHEALRHICWTPISPVATAELDESEAHTIIIITNIPWRF